MSVAYGLRLGQQADTTNFLLGSSLLVSDLLGKDKNMLKET
jgi:hypothetical protein